MDQSGLSFGQALEAVKSGKLIARSGWNGKGMFVFQRPEDTLDTNFLQSVRSLPQSVKDYFKGKKVKTANNEEVFAAVHFGAYLCMKAADDSIVNGWLASQTDILASDWCILD